MGSTGQPGKADLRTRLPLACRVHVRYNRVVASACGIRGGDRRPHLGPPFLSGRNAFMSRWNLAWLLGFVALGLVSLSLAYAAPTRETRLQQKHENLKLVVDVLEEVQQKYVKELTPDKLRELVEDMVNGGLERLDPHSSYMNAEAYRQFMTH